MTNNPVPPLTGFGSTIIKIALVIFGAEILIMLGLYWSGVSPFDWKLVLVDAGLLSIVVAVIAYFGFIRPKDRQILAAIEALAEARHDAEELVRVDALTGVLSRRALLEALDLETERARRYGRDLACIMLDLDNFKAFNDTYGHQFGDTVLHRIAEVIASHCRSIDHLGRYGGEEFLVVLPETSLQAAINFAERVRLAVAGTALDQPGAQVTLSLGVAARSDGNDSANLLISEADLALRSAKLAGRNRTMSGPAR